MTTQVASDVNGTTQCGNEVKVATRSASSTTSRPYSRTRRRRRLVAKADLGWKPMFHLSLALAVAAIVAVWIVTPLSWAYVLWTALTQIPALSKGQPAPPSSSLVFKVLHYLTLAYTSTECLFSIYYRFLAYKCQKLRPPLRHPRKHLRQLFLSALENGTTIEDEEEAYEHRNHLVPHCHGAAGQESHQGGPTEADMVRDEEEAARGSDDGEIKLPPLARRRPPRPAHADGGQTPELSTADLPISDYMSARPVPYAANAAAIRNDAELEDRTDAASVVSRISVRSLDSAMPSSPQSASVRSLRLPVNALLAAKEAVNDNNSNEKSRHGGGGDHPHSRFLPRLTPEDPRAHDFREYVRHWFGGVPFSEIKRDNMADWLAWSMYGQPLHEIEHERKEWDRAGRPALYCSDGVTLDTDTDLDHHFDDVDQLDLDDAAVERRRHEQTFDSDKLGFVQFCLTLCEARAATRFAPGRNPSVHALRLTLDPVRVVSRPLLLYGVVALLQNAVIARAKTRGFREYDDGDATRYLLRMPEGWEPRPDLAEDERPLIFLHGLGMGMAQYATLVAVLGKSRALKRRPILVLLQPHISMSFFQRGFLDPPDQKRCTTGLVRALRLHGMDERAGGCTVLSHSNGTVRTSFFGCLLPKAHGLIFCGAARRSCMVGCSRTAPNSSRAVASSTPSLSCCTSLGSAPVLSTTNRPRRSSF